MNPCYSEMQPNSKQANMPRPDQNVLVTGGSGFVGTALIRRLLAQGCSVRAISRVPRQAIAVGTETIGQLEWYVGDLENPEHLEKAFAGVSQVFHVAGLVDSAAASYKIERANVDATRNVCDLSLRGGTNKLIHISTCDVFGLPGRDEVITERTSYRAWSEPYPDSKIRAAEIVKGYRDRGLVSTIIHPGWVYGPGDRAFLPALIRQIKSGIMPIWSPKGFQIHLIFIEDLVDAIVRAADERAADNEEFLILDDASGVEMADICRRISADLRRVCWMVHVPYAPILSVAWTSQRLTDSGWLRKPMLTTTDVKSFGYRFRYSVAKAKEVLGWSPQTHFEDGIRLALAWHAQNLASAPHGDAEDSHASDLKSQ